MELTKELRGFKDHGVVFREYTAGKEQALGICPLCEDKSGHLYVSTSTRAWQCKKCNSQGNWTQFLELRQAFYQSQLDPNGAEIRRLSVDRSVGVTALKAWRVGWSGSFFSLPIDGTGTLTDIRRYRIGGGSVLSQLKENLFLQRWDLCLFGSF